jgi:murein DD-endopeptidase MepM/ murein hydrolase activator NlpD
MSGKGTDTQPFFKDIFQIVQYLSVMKKEIILVVIWLTLFYSFTNPIPPEIPLSDGFDYPIGKEKSVTEEKDKDAWYNARDFRQKNHLGEDWNLNSGGNTDCGQPIYVTSAGLVVYAQDAGPGWGNVVIVRHRLPNGKIVESLYGHLKEMLKKSGDKVSRRELIGKLGDGGNPCGDTRPYYAHLHFEIRWANCRDWGTASDGYSDDATGWTDPSKFIDRNRKF